MVIWVIVGCCGRCPALSVSLKHNEPFWFQGVCLCHPCVSLCLGWAATAQLHTLAPKRFFVTYMTQATDETGNRYGSLIVLGRAENNKRDKAMWHCLCDCGTETIVLGSSLRYGYSKSCGCKAVAKTKHGLSRTKEYAIWASIIQRCHNVNSSGYVAYGGRGIFVCDRWRNSFEAFLEDMGCKPDNHSIDRIDNSGPYSLENCRWVTHREQMNNTRKNKLLSHNGKVLTVRQWADELGFSYDAIRQRVLKGWSAERALSTPVAKRKARYKSTA